MIFGKLTDLMQWIKKRNGTPTASEACSLFQQNTSLGYRCAAERSNHVSELMLCVCVGVFVCLGSDPNNWFDEASYRRDLMIYRRVKPTRRWRFEKEISLTTCIHRYIYCISKNKYAVQFIWVLHEKERSGFSLVRFHLAWTPDRETGDQTKRIP